VKEALCVACFDVLLWQPDQLELRRILLSAPAPPRIDPSGEVDRLKESCGAFKIPPCARTLHGQPVHIAVASSLHRTLGAGLAYLGHKTTENWRVILELGRRRVDQRIVARGLLSKLLIL